MDLFLSVKAFTIGFIWAGGYYFLLAYALHFFPLPLLYTIRDLLARFAKGIEQAKPKYARWTWIVRLWFARLTAWLLLLILLAGFALSDYWIMSHYFEATHPDFWPYFGVSLALPGLFFLWQLLRLMLFERSVYTQPKA